MNPVDDNLVHRLRAYVLLCLVAAPAAGDVLVSTYTDEDNYQFQRTGIPDLDQERVGLVNLGACHCVPTCTMNLLIYAANHGFPNVAPGPGDWSGANLYLEATQAISDLGQEMAICYGGGVEGECDPTVCDFNGDCVLTCGSRSSELATIGLLDWLGGEADKFNVSYYLAAGNMAPRLHHLAQVSVLAGAPLMRVNYGRYSVVAFTPNNEPIYRRGGGHAMSFVGCQSSGTAKTLIVRNPGASEVPQPDLFGQSPFANTEFSVNEQEIRVTIQSGGVIVSWDTRMMSRVGASGGQLQMLDVVAWIQPKKGYSFTSSNVIVIPTGDSGFGIKLPGPQVIPISGGSVVDIAPDAFGVGYLTLVLPEVGAPQVKYVNLATRQQSLVAEIGGASALASGRKHDLYVIGSAAGSPGEVRRLVPAPRGDLGDYAQTSDLLTLPFGIDAAVYDNETDQLVLVSGGLFKLVRAPRDLGTAGDPIQMWDIPTAVPLGGAMRLAIEPGTGRTWLASDASSSLYGLTVDPAGGLQVEEIARPDIQNPTCVSFDDGGRLYVRADGGVIALQRDPDGLWQRDPDAETPFAGVPLGQTLFMSRSGGNYDPDVHVESQWENIPPDQLPDIGEVIPDCLGDLDGDGAVGIVDFLGLLAAWGPNPGHPADLDGDGTVGIQDFLQLLANWGPCP